jgi:hypothetical protein
VFINYAVWESTEHYKRAYSNPEFQSSIKEYPESTVASPHLFKKVAVPGISNKCYSSSIYMPADCQNTVVDGLLLKIDWLEIIVERETG